LLWLQREVFSSLFSIYQNNSTGHRGVVKQIFQMVRMRARRKEQDDNHSPQEIKSQVLSSPHTARSDGSWFNGLSYQQGSITPCWFPSTWKAERRWVAQNEVIKSQNYLASFSTYSTSESQRHRPALQEREKHCASSRRHHTHNYWMFSRCNWSRLSALHTPWPFPMQPLKVALLECEWSLLCWWKRKMYSRMDMRCEKNVLSDKKGCMGFNRHYERVSQQLHTRGERTPLIGTITSDIIRRYANDRDIPPDTAVSVVFWFPGNSPVSAHEGEGQW